jgi:hypothetical protein
MRNENKIVIGKPDGKRLFGSHGRIQEGNIRMDLRKTVRRHGMDASGSTTTSGGVL